jgi:TolB protein
MLVRVSFAGLAAAAVSAALALPTTAAPAPNGLIAFEALPLPHSSCTQHHPCFPQIFTVAPDGSRLTQLTNVPNKDPGGENPSWSPNGATIAFDAPSGRVNLFTVPASGGVPTELPVAVGRFNGVPSYSPDGRQIAFDQDVGPSKPKVHGIFIANADGSNAHRVTTGIRTVQAFDTSAQWSPDGTHLVFVRFKSERRSAIFMVGVDGSGLRRLTGWKLNAVNPDWSPDGTKIVFQSHDFFSPKRPRASSGSRPAVDSFIASPTTTGSQWSR